MSNLSGAKIMSNNPFNKYNSVNEGSRWVATQKFLVTDPSFSFLIFFFIRIISYILRTRESSPGIRRTGWFQYLKSHKFVDCIS